MELNRLMSFLCVSTLRQIIVIEKRKFIYRYSRIFYKILRHNNFSNAEMRIWYINTNHLALRLLNTGRAGAQIYSQLYPNIGETHYRTSKNKYSESGGDVLVRTTNKPNLTSRRL